MQHLDLDPKDNNVTTKAKSVPKGKSPPRSAEMNYKTVQKQDYSPLKCLLLFTYKINNE